MTIKHINIVSLLLLFLVSPLVGQISIPGKPPGFSKTASELQIPFETFILRNLETLQAEDEVIDQIADIPWRFGDNLHANVGLTNAGVWEELESGERVWRMGIHSPGAYSINLTFNRYRLPPGAELYIYSADRSFVLGAFTTLNNQDDHYFATTLVPGDALVIEYLEPASPEFPGELHLETVTHAYRNITDFTGKFGRSGSCNMNVACEEAEGYENQADAVVMVLVGSNSICSGALINNTNFDGRPFLLSANHCYRNPSTLVFWFNWQSETCEKPPQAPSYNSMSGASSRARYFESDAWLLELNQRVPLEYKPYYAGWNRTLDSLLDEKVVTIHHPRGDIKKFSYALDGAVTSKYVGDPGSGITYWRVTWSGGTTEPTSSGSPLFDSEGRIIGQLHGGYAACGNNEPDWYGRFGYSWDASPDNQNRFSSWLDPNGTNAMAINGYRPVYFSVDPVVDFSAQTKAADTIALEWSLNTLDQPVMIAYSYDENFGIPSGGYSLGDTIEGGGVVIYLGKNNHSTFKPQLSDTDHYFMAWSFNELRMYSDGTGTSALSEPLVITVFPYEEYFQECIMPYGWNQPPYGVNKWNTGWGNNAGHPLSPHLGGCNLFFLPAGQKEQVVSDTLSSPLFDLSAFDTARLNFFYATMPDEGLHDLLTVLFRPGTDAGWEPLIQLDEATEQWENVELNIPGSSQDCQLAFVAKWKGGRGVCIDAIRIIPVNDELFPNPLNLIATPNNTHSVKLAWEMPGQEETDRQPVSWKIYRRGEYIAMIEDNLPPEFIDSGLPIGYYSYYVTSMYDDPPGESVPSNLAGANIELASTPVFLSMTIEGEGTTTPPAPADYIYNPDTPVTFIATPSPTHIFTGWYLNHDFYDSQHQISFTTSEDFLLKAVFVPRQFQVKTLVVPEETGKQQGAGQYQFGQPAPIATTIPEGWRFMHWKAGETVRSTSPSFNLVVTEDVTLTAYFESWYHVALNIDPPGSGTVSGEGVYFANDRVVITATGNLGWVFDYWLEEGALVSSDAEYSFVIGANRNITAIFSRAKVEIKLEMQPLNAGNVYGSGVYVYGDTVTVIAEPSHEWRFIGWFEGQDTISTELTYWFIAENDRHLVALMEPRFYLLTVEIDGKGNTEPPPGSYLINKSQYALLTASPVRGWRFTHWLINGLMHEEPQVEVLMDKEVKATAVFVFPSSTDHPDGIDEGVLVFPNPGTGIFHLHTGMLTGTIRLELYNAVGQFLMATNHDADASHSTPVSFDLTGMRPGLYLLKVSDGRHTIFRKIVNQ